MNDIKKRLANLSPKQREQVLEKLRQQQLLPTAKENQAIPVISREQEIPLSYSQEMMWFWHQFLPENPLYNMLISLQLEGQLNVTVLEQSLKEIIRRHENLRTCFPSVDGKPIQVISTVANINLSIVELPSSPERTTKLKQLASTEAEKPFDLDKGPLLRVTLVKLSPENHILMLTMHHIIYDGWSIGILASELCTLYEAYTQGKLSPLSELTIQYADYAQWQRQTLTGEVLEKHLSYWRQKLGGISPVSPLVTDRPRPEVQSFQGGAEKFELNQELTEKLTQLSQQLSTTLFTTLLSAFFVLLWRYSGESDLVVGSPIASRNRVEIEPLIGMFANILVLRCQCGNDLSFRELLTQVKQTTQEAYKYEDLPFEKLVEELLPERNLSYNPLVQVVFNLLSVPITSWNLPGLRVIQREGSVSTARMDLEVHMREVKSGIEGCFVCNIDLFDQKTIAGMKEHFLTLLKAIVANPQEKISKLPLITATEEQKLLDEWNNTKTDYPDDKCIHQLFEEQVENNPDAIAVVSEKQKLTYSELNSKANQLAHYLQKLGVVPETPVGICVESSVEMVVGLLAILKAGGAYVPLNSNNLQDWESMAVILTQNHLKSKIPDSNAQILCLDTEWELIAKQNTDNPKTGTTATNLAYILNQTPVRASCSPVEHQAVAQRLQWLQEVLQITNQDILLHKTSLTQDVAILEIGLPLISGGSIVIAANDNPTELQKLISQHQVTMVHLYPSELPSWLNTMNPISLNSWRTLLCSGETLSTELAHKFLQRYPVSLHNFYSLPEAGGEITHWEWLEKPKRENVPVGNPGRLSVYVLDQHQNPVPKGVPGEIYVGGSSLARDYLQQKKSQGFIKHPQLGRVLQTGDIGRYHNKGYLEIIGAKQRQTWRKGKRIELADIETALLSISGVEQAYVLAHQTLLVAYVVVAGVWNPKQLHSQIQEQLAPDMMPGAYVPLSSLPLTEKGKVDEIALKHFPVIDEDLVQRWETELKALPEIEKVAVVVQQKKLKLPPLHILDLLPSDLVTGNRILTDLVTPLTNPSPQPEDSDSKALAFSDGGLLNIPEDAPRTLTEALIKTATQFKKRQIIYVLGEGKADFQTYGSLLEEAKSILNGLYQMGLTAGSRAILQIQSLRDYFPILWACIIGGIKPVTVAVASKYEETNSVVKKFYNTWELLEQPPILASDSLIEQLDSLKNFLPMSNLKVVSVSRLANYPPTVEIHQSHPDDVAFFQLTSGSTGAPKCIQETHKGIIAHIHAAQQFNGYLDSDICLNWLPVDHVVPILTTHLKDVYLGCQQIEVATEIILANPLTWLDLIEEYKVTHTWAPNFGFKLVSDSLLKVPSKGWDLSSIKFLMNAGEQVTLPVIEEFLNLVGPYGIKSNAMQPAFGMAEACTCMTYQNQFIPETGVHQVEKSSLGGKLQIAQDDAQDTIDFIDLGKPVPGVQIRITDQNNQLLPEGVIGRFQIKGTVVTPGYLNNTTANQEAFVGEGWFNTGDLGFIINGHLIITGREKEQIVINGVNYYCYEIEAIVNQIEGVEPTYAGACGLASYSQGTEKLAVFFTPQNSNREIDIELIKKIKGQVSTNMGINADYVIPLERQDFPKTTIGKIQRSLMKKMLAKGDFDQIIKELDVQEENNNTIPDWFYQKTWRRKQGNYQLHKLAKIGVFLVFIDKLGLGQKLCHKLDENSQLYVQVELGESFKKINDNHYVIAPYVREDYQKIFQSLAAENLKSVAIIHLWHYDKYSQEITETETLEAAQKTGIYSLLFILKTFGNQKENYPVRLLYVASQSQSLNLKEAIAYEKATVPGLLKTIPQEMPHWHCRHLDLPQESLEVNRDRILEELTIDAKDSEVAYRDGERWVSGIKKINLVSLPQQPLPFKAGGTYLISGGLGGVGVEIAKYLLEHYQAKLLLLGRTSLPDSNSWESYLQQGGKIAEKIQAYQQLQKLGGEVIYQGVDISHLATVQEVVQQTLSGWNTQQLDGVVHLAGSYHESLLKEETPESLAEVLRPKLIGTWVLHQLVEKQPKSLFINFSSINGFFGGTTVGAYAAANSFLDAFSDYQRDQSQLQSYCLAWSMWDEMGMSRGYQMKQLTQAKGYIAVGLSQGMSSLLAGLCHDQPYLMVGLDGSNLNIRRLTSTSDSLQQLTAYFTTNGKGKPNVSVLQLMVHDAVGQPSSCAVVELAEMPLTETGEIDIALLSQSNLGRSTQERVKPRNKTERQIAQIWQDLLGVSQVGIYDNFFELGGNSLLATQVISRLRQAFGMELSLQFLFEYPTIASIAQSLEVLGQVAQNQTLKETEEEYEAFLL
ncbi:SDR family NAD(P)-dependent oxidoreductase [Moorena producens]|uniref:SDR family NAD(P)-dependent oxidoreductase n=1 Tax=Moorena producens TaxID=1155739 RepID=UPI003C75194B